MYTFAIAGCGAAARQHLKHITRVGRLSGVFDLDIEKAQTIAALYNAVVYSSFDAILKDETVDVVCVCTPTGFHAEHSIRTLQAGKHVLCERPLCLTMAAAWQIIETAKFSRKKWMLTTLSLSPEVMHWCRELQDKEPGWLQRFELILQKKCTADKEHWSGQTFPAGNALLVHFHLQMEALLKLLGAVETACALIPDAVDKTIVDTRGAAVLQLKTGALGSVYWQVLDEISDFTQLKLQVNDKTILLEGTLCHADYNHTYEKLLMELTTKTSFETDISDVKLMDAVEKIYKPIIAGKH